MDNQITEKDILAEYGRITLQIEGMNARSIELKQALVALQNKNKELTEPVKV